MQVRRHAAVLETAGTQRRNALTSSSLIQNGFFESFRKLKLRDFEINN